MKVIYSCTCKLWYNKNTFLSPSFAQPKTKVFMDLSLDGTTRKHLLVSISNPPIPEVGRSTLENGNKIILLH